MHMLIMILLVTHSLLSTFHPLSFPSPPLSLLSHTKTTLAPHRYYYYYYYYYNYYYYTIIITAKISMIIIMRIIYLYAWLYPLMELARQDA